MSNTLVKRSRASAEQLSQMVDYMFSNPKLAGGKFKKLHGKLECDKNWMEVTETPNCLGGAVKGVNQWQAVWKELKSRTSTKIWDRKRQQALTGNKPVTQEALSEMEQRIVAVNGSNYIEGNKSVAEDVPMEENLQMLLEDGEEIISISPLNNDFNYETPKSSKKTPRRGIKRKREEDASEAKKQFLDIASKQPEALKMLAECSFSNKIMADALKIMGEGLN